MQAKMCTQRQQAPACLCWQFCSLCIMAWAWWESGKCRGQFGRAHAARSSAREPAAVSQNKRAPAASAPVRQRLGGLSTGVSQCASVRDVFGEQWWCGSGWRPAATLAASLVIRSCF